MAKIKRKDIDFILKSGEGLKVEFKESSNHIDRVMVAFANAEGGKLLFKNGGVLFFAKDPQKHLRHANMTCVAFKDKEGVAALDRKDLAGNFLDIVAEAERFVERNTRTGFRIKGFRRENLPDYPIEAIREGFVNALMHRDYFEKGANVLLKIFPDKIVIDNPGGLVKGITVKDLGTKSRTRNPLIADLFYRVNLAEKIGSGIKRMGDLMRDHGLGKPKIEVTEGFFTIIFHGPKRPEAIIPESAELNERQKKALEHINYTGQITRQEYERINKVPERTANYDLKIMVKKGIVFKVGKARSAKYVIK